MLNVGTHLEENQDTGSMWWHTREKENQTGILLENADFPLELQGRMMRIDSIIYPGLKSLIYSLFSYRQEWDLVKQGNKWSCAFQSGSRDICCLLILILNVPADSTNKCSHKSIVNLVLIKGWESIIIISWEEKNGKDKNN